MCIFVGHMCICVPNMKFLCLTLCQGEVCTYDTNDTNADNANGQSMIVKGSLVDKPNEPTTYKHMSNLIIYEVYVIRRLTLPHTKIYQLIFLCRGIFSWVVSQSHPQ